jgi:quercetin dioxygenase-like cupin family protein
MKYEDEKAFDEVNVFGKGVSNDAYAQYFVGNSYLALLTDSEKTTLPVSNVTFEPGCRNNWHIHHASQGGGQIIICTAGEGWYQEEGKPAQEMVPGVVITIPAEVKHWHGAKKDSWFSHLAIGVPGQDASNEWLEPVDQADYEAL